MRWQFGVLLPRPWLLAHGAVDDDTVAGSVESWFQQTECLLEGASARVQLRVRFLQAQSRAVEERVGEGGAFRPVDSLDVDGSRHLSFDEAVVHEVDVAAVLDDLLGGERRHAVDVPGGTAVETLADGAGRIRGRVVRRRRPVRATVVLTADRAATPFPLWRLRIRVENSDATVPPTATRDEAVRHALLATHTLGHVDGGRFLSLLEPPQWAAASAGECVNVHTFPVLAGEPGSRDLLLSSPIILYDHPRTAPESPGDLHDSTEIDEILSLRTLTLSDAEKREARATDPRAAAIVDRVDAMPAEVFERLHGAVRSLRPARPPERGQPAHDGPAVPWWGPDADRSVSPETDAVVVAGTPVRRGSRVRLHPRRRGTDAHDMFLAGRTATVAAVLVDVDDSRHVAVTLDDDPGAELHQWYGRYRYFSPEEIEPLGAGPEATP